MKYTGIYQEDENEIRKGYTAWVFSLLPTIPIVVASSADLKWVVASGFSLVLFFMCQGSGRLFDLCIRLRRTNILLSNPIERP